ncbi:MAG TPA: hypothetical protein DIS94_11620 [Bacteroidetes bacterium]|nr:hypothetical protein [Bacteroidota bacterium]
MTNKKKFTNFFALILLCFVTTLVACSSKKKITLAEVGNEKIYLYQFEDQFLKTVGSLDSAKKTTLAQRLDFLNLMIKFKLKTMDARERGMLQSPDIQNDLNEYKKNFITAFVIDKYIVSPNIKSLYDMKKYEVRASHILVNLPMPAPSADDSIRAYEKANQIIERIKNGEDFGKVAAETTEDISGQANGGDLYWFTGGQTVPEFEEVVYKLKKGEVSKTPVRTSFGLHIVKLTDKQPRYEQIRASHILIQDKRDSVGQISDSLGTLQTAQEVLSKIKSGATFEDMAAQFSDDPGSKTRGGDLGFFERRRMVQPFDSAVFSLKVGEITDLVRTQFGWHIIKLTEVKEVEDFELQKEKLKTDFKRAPTWRNVYDKYMEKERKSNGFEIDETGFALFRSKMDSNKTLSNHNLDSLFANEKETIVARFKGGEIKIKDVIDFTNINKDFANNAPNSITITRLFGAASDTPVLLYIADKNNIEKDQEYVDMLTEYENGLLSFKVDQEELWSKIVLKPEDIQNYYETYKEKFSYTDSAGVKYRTLDEVKAEVQNLLQQDKFKEMETTMVENLKTKYPVKINEQVLEKAFSEKK